MWCLAAAAIAALACAPARGEPPLRDPAGEPSPAAAATSDRPAPTDTSAIAGPRELLSLYGIDDSHWLRFADGRPLDGDENEALLRLLFVVGRLGYPDVDRFAPADAGWQRFEDQPATHRGEMALLSGVVTEAREERPLPEVAQLFQLPRYYRCQLQVAGQAAPATVYALSIPKAWRLDQPLAERVSVAGFFVKFTGAAPDPLRPVLVARRVAWHPATILGELGMDVGLFDQVRQGTPLRAEDREPFYQLLAIAGRAGRRALAAAPQSANAALAPLLTAGERHVGQLTMIDGVALRALSVRVDDPATSRRFGLERYFEVEVSVTLDPPIRLAGQTYHTFPVICCVRQLPAGFPQGEQIHEHVRIAGFFFKNWVYTSQAAGATGAAGRQVAPLLIGREPQWVDDAPRRDGQTEWLLGGLFVGGIVLLWLLVALFNRGDRRFRQRTIARKFEAPPGSSLDDLRTTDDVKVGGS